MKKNGFTLIETLVAIFLLTLTIGGLLTLAANGYFSVRYARNQIVANNLLQESLEYIRNDRDTAAQRNESWALWMMGFSNQGCSSSSGCIVDPNSSNTHIRPCNNSCEAVVFYPGYGFYGYQSSSYSLVVASGAPSATTYVRTVTVQESNDPNQLIVTSTVNWMNGMTKKTTTQSILITNWHNQ
jgi:Tfp pilus assembly protein PilV